MTGPALAKLLLFWGSFVFVGVAERWRSARPNRPLVPRLAQNGPFVVVAGLVGTFWTLPLARLAFDAAPLALPLHGVALVAVHLLVLDGWMYLWHRVVHAVQPLWRFHEVHHLDDQLDSTTALRFHGVELLIGGLFNAVPLVALGIPPEHVALYGAIMGPCVFWHHSNLAVPPAVDRALQWVVVTPGWHRAHHHARRTHTDSHYGVVLTVWDRLLGTAPAAARRADLPFGVEGIPPQSWSFTHLMARPFSKS